ncbi:MULTISPECIES: prepilin-type N-terminal cleavage/methylation domain-containing protein [Pseudoxanthomonas]|uniref:prepilin-type N-terminal cleavage/methylation domain-containing protein n=1 Tax=Pseudoxanthomonas TaxID=83618 RepID=UPI0028C3E573|nr:prepilin-type N-terminal cleavage/methylation domain-containing protein [Pseudoxanthomonas sp.]
MMRARMRGFTLIEVLVALVLMAAGLALAFATLRSSTAVVTRGEDMAQASERMRAVHGYLRARLASAQPIVFATDRSTLRQARFIGTPQRMRFVADLPDYLGYGGPYLHDLVMDDAGRLQVAFSVARPDASLEDIDLAARGLRAERLADGLKAVRFRYRGLDADNRLGPWQDRWETSDMLPLQVKVEMEAVRGGRWPDLVVTLARSEGGAGGGLLPGGNPSVLP